MQSKAQSAVAGAPTQADDKESTEPALQQSRSR
jgi:hypothetical protein